MKRTKRLSVRSRQKALDRLKYEVAHDLDLDDDIRTRGYAQMTTREVGKIGGTMVKRLVARGEQAMSQDSEHP